MVVCVVTTDVVAAIREVFWLMCYSLDASGKFKYCSKILLHTVNSLLLLTSHRVYNTCIFHYCSEYAPKEIKIFKVGEILLPFMTKSPFPSPTQIIRVQINIDLVPHIRMRIYHSFATRVSQLKICDFSGETFKGFEVL
jgi:hypothetical protein